MRPVGTVLQLSLAVSAVYLPWGILSGSLRNNSSAVWEQQKVPGCYSSGVFVTLMWENFSLQDHHEWDGKWSRFSSHISSLTCRSFMNPAVLLLSFSFFFLTVTGWQDEDIKGKVHFSHTSQGAHMNLVFCDLEYSCSLPLLQYQKLWLDLMWYR